MTHALDDLDIGLEQVTFVDAVKASNVGVAGLLEGGPVELSARNLHPEMFGLVNHFHHVGGVPHHLSLFGQSMLRYGVSRTVFGFGGCSDASGVLHKNSVYMCIYVW